MTTHANAGDCRRGLLVAIVSSLLMTTAAHAAPPIRTGDGNKVPSCVSPERLMAFLRDRNSDLDPRYAEIARWYKQYGEAWRVRWDYAFYQMILETNALKFRRGDGRRGDVNEKQNNFAGIGATGGGVPGERFPDIKTGVHAQIQHLVAYSGESVAEPVAKRTRENQDDIIAISRRLGRPVTFGDLARRWAADRKYAQNIDFVAEQFRQNHCNGPAVAETEPEPAPRPVPARRFPKPSGLGGPKPQMLAGPETLPWQGEGTSVAQAPTNTPANDPVQAPHEAPHGTAPNREVTPRSPVRTLWSRSARQEPAAERPEADTPVTTEPSAPRALTHVPTPPAPSQGAAPEGVEIPGTVAQSPSAQPEAADDIPADEPAPVQLPTFRIAPQTPEPSKLGGPIEADGEGRLPAAAPRALPPGTFVETSPPIVVHRKPEATPAPSQAVSGKRTSVAQAPVAPPSASRPAANVAAPVASPGTSAQGTGSTPCRVVSASYGGTKTLLVQSEISGTLQLTALTVLDGFEKSMLESYAKSNAPGAKVISEFKSKADALAEANAICAAN